MCQYLHFQKYGFDLYKYIGSEQKYIGQIGVGPFEQKKTPSFIIIICATNWVNYVNFQKEI